MTKEIWKSVPGYEGYYEASTLGNVRTVTRESHNSVGTFIRKSVILKPSMQNNGYYRVMLTKDKKHKYMLVHRIIALTFIDNPLNKPIVNHKDENKHNNCVDNLEWFTTKENNNYNNRQYKIAAKNKANGTYDKLRNLTSKPVLAVPVDPSKETITLKSVTDGKNYGFIPSEISAVARGHKKTHYGYVFSYI